jgi:hypothetical protein
MSEALTVYGPPSASLMAVEDWPTDRPKPYLRNPRVITPEAVETVAASIREYGWTQPIAVDENGTIVIGHTRLMAARSLGLPMVPVHIIRGKSPAQIRALRIMDNASGEKAAWDLMLRRFEVQDLVADNYDLGLTGLSADQLSADLGTALDYASGAGNAGALVAAFGVAPFSVLNARDGLWQERKRAWLALGIQSELGRGGVGFGHGPDVQINPNGSLNYTEAKRSEWTKHHRTAPGGSPRPAASLKPGGGTQRGDGSGRPLKDAT